MTIQPSILIWTLISYCLLMLILDRLLFRPMLSFMDQRNARIAAAMQKKEDDERALADAEAKLTAQRELAAQRTSELVEKEIADAKIRAERLIEKASAEREAKIEACATELTAKTADLETGLATGVDRLAKAFVNKLIS